MKRYTYSFVCIFTFLIACNRFSGKEQNSGELPEIFPDYTEITIPPNIAPLNFRINEEGKKYLVIIAPDKGGRQIEINSGNGIIRFPQKTWKRLLGENKGAGFNVIVKVENQNKSVTVFNPFHVNISTDSINKYIAYRLIPPGYYSWSRIRIMQRCLENFSENTVVDNAILDKNCVNCHSFAKNNPDRFMVHVRGSHGGTYFMNNGKLERTDPKTAGMPGSATYPSWHPGGRYIAYSSNQVRQSFYAESSKSIEVFDLSASIVLFDTKDNKIIPVSEEDTTNYLRTFPGWSPDGKYLYYCRAVNSIPPDNPELDKIMSIHHDLVRKSFDETTETFGKTEVIYEASKMGKSVSFPRISPDGKFLVFTLHDFGTFPIWHAEADLYSLNLMNGEVTKLDLNSNEAESYHSWSSDGRWIVFSSKRSDGRSTRPYFSHIDSEGKATKPFMLPQKDPDFYGNLIESYNIPEFITGKISAGPRDFLEATTQTAVKSKTGNDPDNNSRVLTTGSKTSTSTSAHQ